MNLLAGRHDILMTPYGAHRGLEAIYFRNGCEPWSRVLMQGVNLGNQMPEKDARIRPRK